MRTSLVSLWLILPSLTVLPVGCAGLPPPASYYIDRGCTDAGFARGTPSYDACVADQRRAQARAIYDLTARGPIRDRIGLTD